MLENMERDGVMICLKMWKGWGHDVLEKVERDGGGHNVLENVEGMGELCV